ncbi:MAG: thioredoxin domain-containing protein [Magnetovibrionaceae bacterium]
MSEEMRPLETDRNVLNEASSPYLQQHRENPVHWQVWNQETLNWAKACGKPILLSVGYSACHWCHVMAHESFEDEETAAVMNELFVNIKVDREERPDVDNTYQSALALMGQSGGWPLTMFLTPEGEPFWGGTYFPPQARYGRPGFKDVLVSVRRTYDQAPEKVAKNVEQISGALDKLSAQGGDTSLGPQHLKMACEEAIQYVDFAGGGTKGAPKFPQPTFFSMLWRARHQGTDIPYHRAAIITLDFMAQGGIYDHLAGGFARYSTDDDWLVPHFEKMLYDNALLIELMSDVWLETKSDLLAQRVAETIDWMMTDLKIPSPSDPESFGLAAAFDADSEGVEGKYYVWKAADVNRLLGEEAALFRAAYDVHRIGNWEGSSILNRSSDPALGENAFRSAEEEARLAQCRKKLLAEREKRIPPQRDDKVLADWNAMTAHGLVRAGLAFNRPDWIELAETLLSFIDSHHRSRSVLHHTWCQGKADHPAILDDLAHIGRAALALYGATGKADWLARAEQAIAEADVRFWDEVDGGYFLSASDTTDVRHRAKTAMDNAVPSGNGVMADLLARAFSMTGKVEYRLRFDALTKAFSATPEQQYPHLTLLLMATETMANGLITVIVGTTDPADPLVRAGLEASLEHGVLQLLAEADGLADGHPAKGKATIDGKVTAYVCWSGACSLPVTEPEALKDLLRPS